MLYQKFRKANACLQGGAEMIMRQNSHFRDPQHTQYPTPANPTEPNPAYLDQLGGCCKLLWGQMGEV